MHEDKQHILDLLLPALQATRNLSDLTDLRYDRLLETVTATFESGHTKLVNVACDSGTAMIKDILRTIL